MFLHRKIGSYSLNRFCSVVENVNYDFVSRIAKYCKCSIERAAGTENETDFGNFADKHRTACL